MILEPITVVFRVFVSLNHFLPEAAIRREPRADVLHFPPDASKHNNMSADVKALFPERVYMPEERVIRLEVFVLGLWVQVTKMKGVLFEALNLN